MKVYLVFHNEKYADPEVDAVFFSQDKAEEYALTRTKEWQDRWNSPACESHRKVHPNYKEWWHVYPMNSLDEPDTQVT